MKKFLVVIMSADDKGIFGLEDTFVLRAESTEKALEKINKVEKVENGKLVRFAALKEYEERDDII